MKKIKPFIKPIILLTLGILLIILFKDKYIEFFSPKKEVKDFIIELTTDYRYEDGNLLYNINENINSYIVIKNNKELKNFKVTTQDKIEVEIEKIESSSTIALMINYNNYNSIITFDIDNKSYLVTPQRKNDNLEITIEEKQE